ncbi:outer membrane protein OmpA-like peptidoglycan-associated protein [Actinomycetospora succinea]|uniref:Outer membrane protein OmpA-like peptidoglycan-associated protein n=1 Tax=Actinomycetospora succinea TaxID=663603 RepID=A0A4R6UZG2_9PSEU|nr:OmpA family protein [Actinomycetospora succinea]TDQ51025.1 outer membrane protein OmpA-like peptidoglycan-associated protein [Actinomycetospora succinea]
MTGGGHHRGRVTGVPGGAHWWGGRGPSGGGTHAAPGGRRSRVPMVLGLLAVLVVGGAAVAVALTRGSSEIPQTPPAPAASAGSAAPAGSPRPAGRTGPDTVVLQGTIDEVLAAAPLRFAADSATPVPEAAGGVSRVAAVLRASPGPPVTVEGHTAPAGEDVGDAQALSQQRAEEVVRRLEAAGVPAGSLTAVGVGPARPLASLEASRRVEIRVG